MKNNSYTFALFITALGVILMSIESLLIKLTNISGITYSFYIGILMFISLNLVLLKDGINKTVKIYKDNIKVIIIAGILTAFANIFFINSVKHTTIANAVIIISSSPLFATLFAYLFYKQKPHKNIFIASLFIFVGLFIIFSQQLGEGNLFGDILALLCTICFSLIFVFMSKQVEVNRFAVIAFGGFCITVISSFFIESYQVDTDSLYILLVAKTLPASEVSLLTILETILAPIWAWIFLSEIPIFSTIVGGVVILLTLVLNTLYLLRVTKQKVKVSV